MTIQPTAVYSPGASPAAASNRQRFYQTYNTRYVTTPAPQPQYPNQGTFQSNWLYRQMQRMPQGNTTVTVPGPKAARVFGARPILFLAWLAAMMMVSLDEWHTYHILPRPARLWYTSLAFILMALLSVVDALVPFINLFAIGMVISLGYQYYSGKTITGGASQFGGFAANAAKQAAQSGSSS